jgi:hypothetical protein
MLRDAEEEKSLQERKENMPRGVYDRSHLKAKKAATKAEKAAQTATVAAGIALSNTGKTKKRFAKGGADKLGQGPSEGAFSGEQKMMEQGGFVGGGVFLTPIGELREHLAVVSATRVNLSQQSVDHNAKVLGAIDDEIVATIGSMKTWRQNAFPEMQNAYVDQGKVPWKDEKTAAPQPTPSAVAPVVTPAPAPAPAPVATAPIAPPPAPLPFSPQTVAEVRKEAGT